LTGSFFLVDPEREAGNGGCMRKISFNFGKVLQEGVVYEISYMNLVDESLGWDYI
jgi:hypothetical protein